jgi:hypothetical protein
VLVQDDEVGMPGCHERNVRLQARLQL